MPVKCFEKCKTNEIRINYKVILYLLIIVIMIVKAIWVMQCPGPIIFGDEKLYRRFAADIFYLHTYQGTTYPPAYPAIISLAFFFEKNFYTIMKMINVILTSLTICAVWKLGRLFLDEKRSFICTLLSAILPWHYMIPSRIVSENLYFPLIIFTCWYFMKTLKNNTWKTRTVLGILFAVMHLTRHITLVIIPAFAVVWLLDWYENKRGGWRLCFEKKRLMQLGHILLIYGCGYGSWVIYRVLNGRSLWDILGMGVSSGIGVEKISNYATAQTLIIVTILYLSYFLLSTFFLLPICSIGIIDSIKGKIGVYQSKFAALVLCISGAAFIASVRHSWRAEYNYPNIFHILGRYIMFLPILWIVLYFIYGSEIKCNEKKKSLIIAQTVCMLLTVLAILALVKDKLFNLGQLFISDFNTRDLYYLSKNNAYILALLLWMAGILILIIKKRKYTLFTTCALFLMFGVASICSFFYDEIEYAGINGKELSKFNEEYHLENYDFLIDAANSSSLEENLEFWTMNTDYPVEASTSAYVYKYFPNTTKIQIINYKDLENLENLENRRGLILSPVKEEYGVPIKQFENRGEIIGFYEYPIQITQTLQILQAYPQIIYGRNGINRQVNGDSAISIQTNVKNKDCLVFINKNNIGNITIGEDGTAGISLANEYFQNGMSLSVNICYNTKLAKQNLSNTVNIPIIDDIQIISTDPQIINQEEGFYIQEDGNSAMFIQTDLKVSGMVFINGEYAGVMNVNNEGLGIILVPDKFYKNRKDMQVQIKIKDETGEFIESNIITIPVS